MGSAKTTPLWEIEKLRNKKIMLLPGRNHFFQLLWVNMVFWVLKWQVWRNIHQDSHFPQIRQNCFKQLSFTTPWRNDGTSIKHICRIRHFKQRYLFCFPWKKCSLWYFFHCLRWSRSDYFLRCSNSKCLPWLFHVLKISVIIINDRMKKETYFSFTSQHKCLRQLCVTHSPSCKWAVRPWRPLACETHFVPPPSCHITSSLLRTQTTNVHPRPFKNSEKEIS